MTFRFIGKTVETVPHPITGEPRKLVHVEYEAEFFGSGRVRCKDTYYPNGHFLNTASNVSYYSQLKQAAGA